MSQAVAEGHRAPAVEFTVDGQPFKTDEREQLASAILTKYAKVDPANYELGELEGRDPQPKVFKDNEVVHIHPGARFVTIRVGPGPVE
jgi:hypothetical protein